MTMMSLSNSSASNKSNFTHFSNFNFSKVTVPLPFRYHQTPESILSLHHYSSTHYHMMGHRYNLTGPPWTKMMPKEEVGIFFFDPETGEKS